MNREAIEEMIREKTRQYESEVALRSKHDKAARVLEKDIRALEKSLIEVLRESATDSPPKKK